MKKKHRKLGPIALLLLLLGKVARGMTMVISSGWNAIMSAIYGTVAAETAEVGAAGAGAAASGCIVVAGWIAAVIIGLLVMATLVGTLYITYQNSRPTGKHSSGEQQSASGGTSQNGRLDSTATGGQWPDGSSVGTLPTQGKNSTASNNRPISERLRTVLRPN
jgi:hypothetical protein